MADKSKKKKVDNSQQLPLVGDEVVAVPTEQPDLSVDEYTKASMELQKKRHDRIGSMFDKAASVIESYLGDPATDIMAKMLPAKLATDIYMAQEKFKREDERIEIEKRRLTLEEVKVSKLPLSGTFNQQNNFFSSKSPEEAKANLENLKKKQEELLSSLIPKNPPPKS